MEIVLHSILITSALGGFLLAFYIQHKKRAHQKMVCPLNSDCDAVVYSDYSKFFGLPLEILGLFYYGLIASSYSLFLIIPSLPSPAMTFVLLVLTITAFLFSLYLTFIQAFAIKQWCAWCLISAGLCGVILAIALGTSEFSFISLLAERHDFIVILHVLGVALGLGGATITDIFFFKFLKDLRISEQEADTMRTLSQIIWFALAILLLTGFGLYLPQATELHQSGKFLVKMLVVGVIIVNGAFLNILVAPKLVKISFGQKHKHQPGELHYERKIAFALGAVSLVSWYSAFILGMLPDRGWNFVPLTLVYLSILALGIIGSQLMERFFIKRGKLS